MTLIISKLQHAEINSHCEAAYPDEGCGALLGTIDSDDRHVATVIGLVNAGETRNDWFEIDPRDFLKLERRAREENVTVLGFFHSHPDAPCRPSSRDLERAWPVYSYVIVTVELGVASDLASWILAADSQIFEQQPIHITGELN